MSAVLLIDADASSRTQLSETIRNHFGYSCFSVADGHRAMDYLLSAQEPGIEAVLLDMELREPDAIRILDTLRRAYPELPVIALADKNHEIREADILRSGACGMIYRPISSAQVGTALHGALQLGKRLERLMTAPGRERKIPFSDFLGQDEGLRYALMQAREASRNNANVMIQAEPGSGISMLARAIHDNSLRGERPFIACDHPGDLQEAIALNLQRPGGTIFIHHSLTSGEIAPETLASVVKLLLFNDTRLVLALPEARHIAQVIPEKLQPVLTFATVHLPSLRNRGEDILLLANHFLRQTALALNMVPRSLSPALCDALTEYRWPQNIKELQHTVYQMLLRSEREMLTADDFYAVQSTARAPAAPSEVRINPFDNGGNLRPLEAIEADVIRLALASYGGTRSDIARKLGIGRTTLYRKVQQLELTST